MRRLIKKVLRVPKANIEVKIHDLYPNELTELKQAMESVSQVLPKDSLDWKEENGDIILEIRLTKVIRGIVSRGLPILGRREINLSVRIF